MDGFIGLALGIAGALVLVAVLGILVGRYLLPAHPQQDAPAPAAAPPPPVSPTLSVPPPPVAPSFAAPPAPPAAAAPPTPPAPAASPAPPATGEDAQPVATPTEIIAAVVADEPAAASEPSPASEPSAVEVTTIIAPAAAVAAAPRRGGATAVSRPATDQKPAPRGGATAVTGQPPAAPAADETATSGDRSVEDELRERLAHLEMEFSRLETGAVTAWDRTMPALQQHIETLETDLANAERELRRTQQALADSGEQIDQLLAKSRPKMGGATRA